MFDQMALLSNPQLLNSYSYSANDPIGSSDPSGLYNVQSGKVDWGDTAVSIGNQLNQSIGAQYGAYFTGDALLAYNGGKQPVVGGYYGYSIDLSSRYCGGCQTGLYYPPVSSPGAPNFGGGGGGYQIPATVTSGGSPQGSAPSSGGMGRVDPQSTAPATNVQCSLNTHPCKYQIGIMYGVVVGGPAVLSLLPESATAWSNGLTPLTGIIPAPAMGLENVTLRANLTTVAKWTVGGLVSLGATIEALQPIINYINTH
jgi:hypothetical protein